MTRIEWREMLEVYRSDATARRLIWRSIWQLLFMVLFFVGGFLILGWKTAFGVLALIYANWLGDKE